MRRVYLDHAGTTPTDPEVVQAMLPYFTQRFGNPSSIHSFGQEARQAIEVARKQLAALLGARPEEIIFTSGGTESDNFALQGVALALQKKGKHLITTKIEHHAVLEPLKFLEGLGFEVTYLGVDHYGLVDPQELKKALRKDTILVSIMYANNEIGTIQPIKELAQVAHSQGACFHTDAVQAVGHIPIDVNELGVDLLSLSGHKFYGPKGVGALFVRKGTRIKRFLHGGDQEQGRRASTHNVPGIVGIGKAAQLASQRMQEEVKQTLQLRDRLITEIPKRIKEVRLNGHPTQRLPNNVNFGIRYIEGESMLLNLDLLGIAASTGSACTSTSLEPSHVLLAIGVPAEEAHGSLRLTLGRGNTLEDVEYLLEVLPQVVDKLRNMSPLYPPSQ